MEKQTKKRLLESSAFVIVTFLMSLHCANEQLGDRIMGWAYVGYYIGRMILPVFTSLAISLSYFVITKRFWRIFFNSLWITVAITFLFF